jgi:hypothetical protein
MHMGANKPCPKIPRMFDGTKCGSKLNKLLPSIEKECWWIDTNFVLSCTESLDTLFRLKGEWFSCTLVLFCFPNVCLDFCLFGTNGHGRYMFIYVKKIVSFSWFLVLYFLIWVLNTQGLGSSPVPAPLCRSLPCRTKNQWNLSVFAIFVSCKIIL